MRLLLVEDDVSMSRALTRALVKRGFEVTQCFDGARALRLIKDGVADAVLLDLGIPALDGLHLIQRVRSQGITTPILILTARGAVGDRVTGLNAGADDYLPKPFDLDELEARIRALLRRAHAGDADLQCGELRFEQRSGTFYRGEDPIELTPREQALLKALAATPGRAVTKERLFHLVFAQDESVQLEALEVIVHRLRKKLASSGAEIVTLRGLGYLLRPQRQKGRS